MRCGHDLTESVDALSVGAAPSVGLPCRPNQTKPCNRISECSLNPDSIRLVSQKAGKIRSNTGPKRMAQTAAQSLIWRWGGGPVRHHVLTVELLEQLEPHAPAWHSVAQPIPVDLLI